jgi:hypothetical protein|tara:strand:+ start:80 stop:364 length:285 start_codon:yes stop_codon:yes gene_type:complete
MIQIKKGNGLTIPLHKSFNRWRRALSLLLHGYIDLSATFLGKFNITIGNGEDGVILAYANILTRVPFGAALAQNDISRDYFFATIFLDAEAATG